MDKYQIQCTIVKLTSKDLLSGIRSFLCDVFGESQEGDPRIDSHTPRRTGGNSQKEGDLSSFECLLQPKRTQ